MQRILVAEDDAVLLELTGALLGKTAQVDCARTAAAALRLIAQSDYDLLITDLNMEHAGDGLLLAGAMRSLHPGARSVLITGYPNFPMALAAIQSTLDQVLIKPVDIETMRGLQDLGANQRSRSVAGKSTLWDLLERQQKQIVAAWLELVEADPQLSSVPLSAAQRLDHMETIVEGLFQWRGGGDGQKTAAAAAHGRQREAQYPSPDWVLLEISCLRRAIFDVALRELLELDLSRFPQDLFELNLHLDADVLESLRAFGLERR